MLRIILSSVACLALQYFFTFSHKWYDLQKNVFEHKIQIFSRNFSHSKKNSASYHKCTQMLMYSTRYSCQILIKLQFCRQILRKYSITKLHHSPPRGSRVVPCERADRWTDRNDETNSRFQQFCEIAYHKSMIYECENKKHYKNDEKYQLDAIIMIYYHVSDIYRSIFRNSGCVLLHVLFSTRCCDCGSKEPVCSLVHCV